MGKPAYQLYKTDNKFRSEIVILDHFTIKGISDCCISLETSQYLSQNNICIIELDSSHNEKIAPTATVVWSALKKSVNVENNTLPIYEAFLEFVDLDDSERLSLDKLISEFPN